MKIKYNQKEFEAFIWYHLKHKIDKAVCPYHRELIASLKNPRIAIAAPRGHAKSTFCSFFYPLYICLENPGVKILLVSATGTLAEYWVSEIRKELESNLTLKEFYGDQELNSDKWTNEEIHLANGSVIQAKGAGRQIRGFRPNIIIGDDLETDEMVVSVDQRRKFDNWFWATLMGTITSDAQCVVIGTILHPDSFLAELVNKGRSGWKTRFYQAIKLNGESLWPDQWPLELLTARKDEMGTYAFAQEYMNDPLPDDMRTFQRSWLKFFEREPQGCVYFTMVDPAISLGSTNDFTAIVTVAVDNSENIYVVDVINKRMLPSETIDAVFKVYKRYESAVVGIESVGFQKMLKFEIDKQKQQRNLFPVMRELSSGGRRKSLRIEQLQPRFQSGKILIKESQEDLITQLLRFPSPRCHDDIIDALAYLPDIIHPAGKKVTHINPNSFLARMEKRRYENTYAYEAWGNHKLQN